MTLSLDRDVSLGEHVPLAKAARSSATFPLRSVMALSGHENLRTLGIYVNPGTAAVARLLAETDPERRRR